MTRRPADPDRSAIAWTVVLPFKGGAAAKSRLGASGALARAITLDCLDAVVQCPGVARVLVVTPDAGLARDATAAGATVVPESRPGAGLIAALGDGLALAGGPTAILLGDLPALRPRDLSAALQAATTVLNPDNATDPNPDGRRPQRGDHRPLAPPMAYVPDAEGTGTVLLAATEAAMLRPSFGPASAAAHARAGAVRLDLALPHLRRDVDTPADLATAQALGVGERTAAVLTAAAS